MNAEDNVSAATGKTSEDPYYADLVRFFNCNREQLVESHHNKYVVVHANEIVDYFDSHKDAYFFADERYEEGTYLVAHCVAEDEESATFRSRIA